MDDSVGNFNSVILSSDSDAESDSDVLDKPQFEVLSLSSLADVLDHPLKTGDLPAETRAAVWTESPNPANVVANKLEESSSDSDSSSDVSDTVSIRTTRSTFTTASERASSPYDGFDARRVRKTADDVEIIPPKDILKNLSLSESTSLLKIGTVRTILDNVVVIEADRDSAPLDLDSALFLTRQVPLGRIFDVFGPVIRPLYSVRFEDPDDFIPSECSVGTEVFIVPGDPQLTSYVFVQDLRRQKGTDASWEDNNELPPEMEEFSDDETERAYRQELQRRKRAQPSADAQPFPEMQRVVKESQKLEKYRKPRKNRKSVPQQPPQNTGGDGSFRVPFPMQRPPGFCGPAPFSGEVPHFPLNRPDFPPFRGPPPRRPAHEPPHNFHNFSSTQTFPRPHPVPRPCYMGASQPMNPPVTLPHSYGTPVRITGPAPAANVAPVRMSAPSLEPAKPLVTNPKLLPSAEMLFYNPKNDATLTEQRPRLPRNFMRF